MSKLIDEIIEKVKSELCDKYCKYPEQWEGTEEDMIEEICSMCPLNEL